MSEGSTGPMIRSLRVSASGGHVTATTAATGSVFSSSLLPTPRREEPPGPDLSTRLTSRAAHAQEQFSSWSETSTDRLLRDIATTLTAEAPHLAALTVRETGIGNVPDKIRKITHASRGVAD